jgi:opacity protein-like surface antigen
MKLATRAGIVALTLICHSRSAAASTWFVAPFAGATAGTRTGFIDLDGAESLRKFTIGAAAGWQGDRWFGVEGELALLPAFFESEIGLVKSSRVTTANGNVVISPWRTNRVRPYVTIGAGLVRVHIADVADVFTTSATLPAINGGAGVRIDLRSRFGLRGDVRYFRTRFDEPPPSTASLGERFLQTWRISAGVVVGF